MTDPCLSSYTYDLAVIAAILAVALLFAIGLLCLHIRDAVLGRALLRACANDYQTAAIAVQNIKAENEAARDLFVYGASATHVSVDVDGRRRYERVAPEDVQ